MDDTGYESDGFETSPSWRSFRDSWDESDELKRAKKRLRPLLIHLEAYDEARRRLEQQGGDLDDMVELIDLLEREIMHQDAGGKEQVSLAKVASLRAVLRSCGHLGLHLEVRQLANRMPVYYLCRVKSDYWYDYALVVEDLHVSPGYPWIDDRFTKMMTLSGRQRFYLRASLFRAKTKQWLRGRGVSASDGAVDRRLIDAAVVLQSAWHEDQRPVSLIADAFTLPHLMSAVELLYLCLGSDLCALRDRCDEPMTSFFHEVHPNAAISQLLGLLPAADGAGLDRVPDEARRLYVHLAKRLKDFLTIEVPWSGNAGSMPLQKLILANFTRLDSVVQEVGGNRALRQAAWTLEQEADWVQQRILKAVLTK